MVVQNRAIYCDCGCGEKMAEYRNGKLVITDRRRGKKHVLVLPVVDKDGSVVQNGGVEGSA